MAVRAHILFSKSKQTKCTFQGSILILAIRTLTKNILKFDNPSSKFKNLVDQSNHLENKLAFMYSQTWL
jgi:hypothetical protein